MPQPTWYQQALTPPDVVEVNVRIGVIPSEDHVQILAEMKDPTTDILIGQWSTHHTTMHGLPDAFERARAHVMMWLAEAVEPF